MAPLVGKNESLPSHLNGYTKGWTPDTLTIPEVSFADLSPEKCTPDQLEVNTLRIMDDLLRESSAGIIKIVDLPPANVDDERAQTSTLITLILKQLFGAVFFHPRRGADKTFNVTSLHLGSSEKAAALPNYDTNQVLLPHADHAHYTHPARVQDLYALEGESENTFISSLTVLSTLKREAPDLYEEMSTAPMAMGRVAHFYQPTMYQATVDPAVTKVPGFPDRIKRVRWHPHLTGSLLSPFEKYHKARLAYQKFQEIMRRETHQLSVTFKPGELYVWDNFRLLHGRERVLKVPRTSVGQTVPEQVVDDAYRSLRIGRMTKQIDEKWLVHLPSSQLHDMVRCVDEEAKL